MLESIKTLNNKKNLNFANIAPKLLTANSRLGDFFRKNDLDQGTILLQNVTVSKKNFNFAIFKPKKLKLNINGFYDDKEIEDEKKRKEKELQERNNINFNDPIFQYYNIKVDANSKLLGDTDYYRELIKEKLTLENSYRNE